MKSVAEIEEMTISPSSSPLFAMLYFTAIETSLTAKIAQRRVTYLAQ
jgi:hypothetical protein